MDATLAGLVHGCAEALEDNAPRLILADWLEDHGQPERAELVRLQCRLADWVPDWQERLALIPRQDELLTRHRNAWLGPLTRHCHHVEFVRGLCRVWVTGKTFATTAFGTAFLGQQATALVESVRLVRCKGLGHVASRAWLAQVPALSLAGLGLGDGDFAWLQESPHAAGLVALDLANNQLSAVALERLRAAPFFPNLARLVVRNNDLPDASGAALLRAAGPRLRDLDATLNPLQPATLKKLADRSGGRAMNALGMEFVRIPAGSFLMGAPADEPGILDDEKPQHPVRLTRPFWLGRFEVTQDDYFRVTNERPAEYLGAQRPVERVTWTDATGFCTALGQLPEEVAAGRTYRLATEAEWEHACRAGTFTAFHTGPTHALDLINCQQRFDNGEPGRVLLNRTSDVGSYPPNAFGLYDMHGNVWEWLSDVYSATRYRKGEEVDPVGPAEGYERALRGGCWEALGRWCRSAKRLGDPPTKTDHHTGFRVVLVTAAG